MCDGRPLYVFISVREGKKTCTFHTTGLFTLVMGKKEQLENYMEQSFACITQQKTKERLSKARCVSLQGKKHPVR